MIKYIKFYFKIIFWLMILLVVIGLIPILHDFIVDKVDIGHYDIESGIITDVYEKKKGSRDCQYIKIDDFDIFVKCGDLSEINLNVGDTSEYYIYNDNAYYTKAQMQSSNSIVKVLDFGMIGIYILMTILIIVFNGKIYEFFDIKKIK